MTVFEELKRRGLIAQTVSYTHLTHEHDMVKYFGGRTVNIEEGRVVFDDYIGGAYEG